LHGHEDCAAKRIQPAQSAAAFMAISGDRNFSGVRSRVTLPICASAHPSKMLKHFPAAVAGTVAILARRRWRSLFLGNQELCQPRRLKDLIVINAIRANLGQQ
jgi:hypothetical protein